MEYNDYELVSLAQENNEDALILLHNKYKDLIYKKSKKVFGYLKNKGLELSDVIQEAMIGFEEAIRDYNQDDNALFYSFSMLCIDRQLKSLISKHNRCKYKILNEAITLDDYEDVSLYEFISNDVTPETELFSKEITFEIYKEIKDVLTEFENIVFELKLQGYNYCEIAKFLDLEIKDIYNAINRVRNKVNKIINK